MIFKKSKLRFLCIYLPPLAAKCAPTVKNVIKLIKLFLPDSYSFFILGDFNLPNINWRIPYTSFNESHEFFLDFCTDNFLTQVIEKPTHKNGNILDLLICNHFGLDKITSLLTSFPLTTTCDHNLISFNIKTESQKIPNSKVVSYNF